jgi:hypothetical protein
MAKKTIADRRKAYRAKREEMAEVARAKAAALSADTPSEEQQPVVVPDRVFQNLGRIATALEDIATFMRVITSPPGTATPTAEVPLQTYMSGQWRRRAGDIYDRVAEPGSPNAGTSMADEMFGTAHDAPEKQDE